MSRREDGVRLRHMLDYAQEALTLMKGKSRSDLDLDRLLELGITRLVEIVGEAANQVSQQTRNRYGQVPWSQIVGLRNRLVHAYDAVDLDILWDIVEYDLPPLIEQLEAIIVQDA